MNVPPPPRGLGPAGTALWASARGRLRAGSPRADHPPGCLAQQDMNANLERLIGEVGSVLPWPPVLDLLYTDGVIGFVTGEELENITAFDHAG